MAEHRLTDPAPTRADVDKARETERVVAEQTYKVAADRLPRQVRGLATDAATKVSRRYGVIALIVAFLVPLLFSIAAYSRSGEAQQDAASARDTVNTALERLNQANDTLEARGQAPVPTPPGGGSPAEAITAAVLAQVLASLPPTFTVDQVADRLRDAVVGALQATTLEAVTEQAEAYFIRNPPEISAGELQAAVDRAVAADPPADGQDGTNGMSPPCLFTEAMCQGDDGAAGTDGVDGQDGRSVVSGPEPVRLDDGSCIWRTTFDREPLVLESPAGDAACPGGGLLGIAWFR